MKYSLYIDLVQHGVPQVQAEIINAKYKNVIIKPNRVKYKYLAENGNKGIELNYDSTSVSLNAYIPIMIDNVLANCDDMKIDVVNKEVEKLKEEENKDYCLYIDLLDHCIPAEQAFCISRLLEKFINKPNMLKYQIKKYQVNKNGINREIIISRNDNDYSFEILVPLIKNDNIANVRDMEVIFASVKEESQSHLTMKNGNFKMSFVREYSDSVKDGFYVIEGKSQDFNDRLIKEEYYDDEAYQHYYERVDSFDDFDAYVDIMKDIEYEDSPKNIGLLPDYHNAYIVENMNEADYYFYIGSMIKHPNYQAKRMNEANKTIDYQLKRK